MSDDALKYAGEAFWLRPDAIQKIQGDPSYRDLGQPFDDFRRRLRDKVQSDTEEILRVEVALRELAAVLDPEHDSVDTFHVERSKRIIDRPAPRFRHKAGLVVRVAVVLQLLPTDKQRLELQAARRGKTVNALAGLLIETILADDLFAAVLDD